MIQPIRKEGIDMWKRRLAAMLASVMVLALVCQVSVGETGVWLSEDVPTITAPQIPSVPDEPSATTAEAIDRTQEPLDDVTAHEDADEDGVEEFVERVFGTSGESSDSDGDGLSDYTEIYQLHTDPLSTDGDANGIADGDEDTDGDAVSNREELSLATDPSKKDSDSDGIEDGEELTQSGTDPLEYDTDADGVNDGYEQQLGTDPAVPQESFTVSKTYTSDRTAATVSATIDGELVDSLAVRAAVKDGLFPTSMPGYLGEACDVTADGAWEDATVSFAVTGAGTVHPTVYYFSEANQTLQAVETTVDNGVATAAAETAGTYVLLDRAMYESAFVWEDSWGASEVYAGVEVVLVTDDSGSMDRHDPDNERLTVARDLIDRLPGGSRIGVVRVASEAQALTPALTADKEAAKAYLDETYFVSDGNTAVYTGIQQAVGLLEDSRPLAQKVMIVISDGFPTDYALYEETVAAVADSGVRVFYVSLGTERQSTIHALTEFAQAVNADTFTAKTADELDVIYEDISRLVDLATDTDGDTIPDYYEDHMIAFNGVTVPLDKTKADTDEDGVPDQEEVSVELIVSDDGTQVLVKGMLLSDPSMSDSDADGDPDSTDAAPYDNTFTGKMSSEYANPTVSFAMDYDWFAGDNTVYNPALSEVSSLFSSMAYEKTSINLSDASGNKTLSTASLAEVLTYFGMEDTESYSLSSDYHDIHLSEVVLGHRTVAVNGKLQTVLAMVVRGTNATIEEWSSNCDIGDITKDTPFDDWMNTDNHKGFDIAANRIMAYTEQYMERCGLYEDTLTYWVTGHSRGAGIANIIGASLESQGKHAFTYTFASPNTTLATDAASYRTIFNLINIDDFVPCLPMTAWGYSCYGVSSNGVSVYANYEKDWETYTGVSDYNSDADGMGDCVLRIGYILTDGRDPREDCYRYTCTCHGDGTNPTITIKNTGMSESSREKAIAKIPSNALPYCQITRYDGGWVGGWDFEVCQSPAYFMQLLAAFMGGEIDAYRFAVELNIADRYEDAKSALVSVGLGGAEHPHYPETYCFLADRLTAASFG